jgi:NTE family protein
MICSQKSLTNILTLDQLRTKKVGLVLSSGFFGFYAHAGCLCALAERGIYPQGFSGSSAGAIIAALGASGLACEQIRERLFSLKKKDFWDPEPWHRVALHGLSLFRGWHGYLDGDKFALLLQRMLPVAAFEELRYPCVITTINLSTKKREWRTAGSLAEAVQASCTVPWLFKFKSMQNALHVDGGFADKAPVEALARHMKPEALIVHYLKSRNLRGDDQSFLTRRFSPGKAQTLAVTIGRHEHYLTQKRLVDQMGIPVLEIAPELPSVSPAHIDRGPAAFEEARRQTLLFLKSLQSMYAPETHC